MPHPLIDRLVTELDWPCLDSEAALAAHLALPGVHCLFVPGDPVRNLETADAAVILPELRVAFQQAFDCALVGDAIETALRERHNVLKTPGFLFFRDGRLIGAIARVRDWNEYLARISQFLAAAAA